MSYTPTDREQALHALEAWASSRRREDHFRRNLDALLDELEALVGEAGLAEGLEHPNAGGFLGHWLHVDAPLGHEPPAARTLLSSDEAARLSTGSRRFLRCLAESEVGVYEVIAVDPGRGCTVRDLARDDDRTIEVSERTATRMLVTGDVLAARVMEGGDGRTVFDGILPLGRDAGRYRARLREHAGGSPASGLPLPRADLTPLVLRWWFADHYGPQPMEDLEPVEVNDELLESGLSTYQLAADAPGAEALAQVPGMVDDGDGEWLLYEDVPGGRRLAGKAAVAERRGGRHLVLEAPGRRSMKRLREAVRKVFGKTMRHQRTEYEPPELVPAGRVGPLSTQEVVVDPGELGVDPEAPGGREQLVRAVLQRHLEDWMDEPVPALGGLTPRAAAGDPERRDALVLLLRDHESRDHVRARRDGTEPLDFDALRRELGLG